MTVDKPGVTQGAGMANFAKFLRQIVSDNPTTFRVMGPDETESNKLSEIYKAGKKVWVNGYLPEDEDGGNLSPTGRVMEMLSEHTVEGWLEGYILSGRHGMLNSYEPFIHIIDSMVNQHAKWIEKCLEVSWREAIASLNILLTSTVWRQGMWKRDHDHGVSANAPSQTTTASLIRSDTSLPCDPCSGGTDVPV
ncbi:hypothetical protein MRB53_041293 [Persea americana]|nr:hypothetical protein MRB53_041293 [Persea americana]